MAVQNDLDIKLEINNNKCDFTLKYVHELLNRVNTFLDRNYSETDKYKIYVNKLLSVVDISFAAELLMKIICIKNGLSEEEWTTHDLKELFNKLPSHIQSAIVSNMNTSIYEFQNAISDIENSSAYERCRYITNNFCNPDYQFIKELTLSLYKIVTGKDYDQELKFRNIGITENEYDSRVKSLEKMYIKKLYEKAIILKNNICDNYTTYIDENILTCDYSLYIELSYKMYDQTGKSYGHESKDLYKKLDGELLSLFAKGIYSQFEYNRTRKNFMYDHENLYSSMHYSLKSIFYPVDFENNYKKERNDLFKDIKESFKKSRYCTLNYYYNYDLLEKYCYVVKDLNDFLENERALVSKSIKFKKLFPDLVYQKWYMYNIGEIDDKRIEKLYEVKKILLEKNMVKYLHSRQYGYLIKNLLNYSDNQIDSVIARIRDYANNKIFCNNMHRIDKDLIDEYCCNSIQNEVFEYLNKHSELNNKCDIKRSDIDYIYKLISNSIIKYHDRLIINLIKNNYVYDIKKIEQLIKTISSINMDEKIKQDIIDNLGPFISLTDDKLHVSLYIFGIMLIERKKFKDQSCDFNWNELSNLLVDDTNFSRRCILYRKIFGNQEQNYSLYFKIISNMELKEVEFLVESGYFAKFNILDKEKIYKYLCDKEILQEYRNSNKFMNVSLEEYKNSNEFMNVSPEEYVMPKKLELYTKFKQVCMYDKRGKQGKKSIDEGFNKIWNYIEQDENHLLEMQRIIEYQVVREHPEILKKIEFNEGTVYLLGDFNNLYYKIVNKELDDFHLLSDDQYKKIEIYLLQNTSFIDELDNSENGEKKQSGEHLRKIHQMLSEKKILPLISKSMWQYGDKDTSLNILEKISNIKFKNLQLIDDKKEFLAKYYMMKHRYETEHKDDFNYNCDYIDSLLDYRLNYVKNIISKYNNSANREDINTIKSYLKDAIVCGMGNLSDYIKANETINNMEIYSSSNYIDWLDMIKTIGVLSGISDEKELWLKEQSQNEVTTSNKSNSIAR